MCAASRRERDYRAKRAAAVARRRRAGVAESPMAPRDLPLAFASPDDVPAIAAMSRDFVESGLGWEYRPARIARMVADADTVALVARDGTWPAGFAFMTVADAHAHLVLLAVQPAHRRRGVARRMVAWLVESARTAGVASVHVELREANRAAHALYQDAGFADTLRVPGYYRGREAAVRMLKLLRRPDAAAPAWRPPTLDRR